MDALRRTAPIPSARQLPKRLRGAAPATARVSSTHRGGADQKLLSAPGSKYVKVMRNGIIVEMEVLPVGADEVSSGGLSFLKRPRVMEEPASAMAPEKSAARRAGADEKLSVPCPKRAKVTRNSVETSVEPALGTLRKRMAVELDALHALLKKAELLSSAKNSRFVAAKPRSEAPVEDPVKTPPEKRRKVSALAEIAEAEIPEDADEFIDICGGVSPVAIQNASPIVSVEKASETGNSPCSTEDADEFIDICGVVSPVAIQNASPIVSVEKAGEAGNSPCSTEDADEFIDICGGVSPVAIQNASPVASVEKAGETGNTPCSSIDSGSSSSSASDSDSDSNETVDMPVPPAVLPDKNGASAQALPEPASEAVHTSVKIPVPQRVLPKENGTSVQPSPKPAMEVVQRTEPEKPKDKKRAAPSVISKAALIAKAKVRRMLLEMERAVLPDESIYPQDLKDLCIPEYGCPSTMRQLGLFLKADA